MQKNKVVHLTTSVSRAAGGLFESVRNLSQGVFFAGNKFQVDIIGTRDSYTDQDIGYWQPLAVQTHKIWGPKRFGYSRGMTADLFTSNPDLVHVHGMWQYPSIAVLRWARRTGKPYIVSPHGMIEPWSLQQSRLKKRMAFWLYQRACFEKAACLRATSTLEAQSIRLAGFKNLIALIPNGVVVPSQKAESRKQPSEVANQPNEVVSPLEYGTDSTGQPCEVISQELHRPGGDFTGRGLHGSGKAESRGQRTEDGGRRTEVRRALFLSRIHPKKGLLNLVKAWAAVQRTEGGGQRTENWELLIVGPDEGRHLAEVRAAVRAAGLEKQILFQGEVMGEAKTRLYCESDLFVLPSFSENFGLVIAEALSCGVPVITTHATPWEELETRRCGWWIETGVEPLVKALREAMALSDVERSEMGRRGRQLIEDHYTWPAIARQMCAVYEWMLGAKPKPECVVES